MNEIPARLGEQGLRPEAAGYCSGPGMAIYRINLSDCPINRWLRLHEGNHYGFTIIRQSATFSGLSLSLRRPKTGDAEELIPVFLGMEYSTSDPNPVGQELWWHLSPTNQTVTVDIAVALRPGLLKRFTPVLMMGTGGAVAVVGDFDSVAADEASSALFVRAALTAQDITEAAASRNIPLEGRAADADAGFLNTRRGLLVNARMAAESITSAAQRRLRTFATNDAAAENDQLWLGVRAQIGGLDTSAGAGSRAVPIHARIATSDTGFLGSLTGGIFNARIGAVDIAAADWTRLFADEAANITNGRANPRGLWCASLDVKRDSDGTLHTPTEMNRSVSGSVVNPGAAGTVIATLDSRGLTNKSILIDVVGGATTVDIEVSRDNTTWYQIVNALATPAGVTIGLTALQHEVVRGFRYVRVLTDAAAAASTITAIISAQGA